jgi:hypothetical protein
VQLVPGDDLVASALQGSSQRAHLDGLKRIVHVADELVDEFVSEVVVRHGVEFANGLLGRPGRLDLSVAITAAHRAQHLLGAVHVEALGGHGEQAPRLIERVVLSSAVSEDVVLHAPTREVHLSDGVAHDVKGVGHQLSVGQHRGEGGSLGGREIERARGDVTEPLLTATSQPRLGSLSSAIRRDVQQLALIHVHDRGHELLATPLAELHRQVFVEPEGAHVVKAIRVIHQGRSVGEDGVVDGVPVTSELFGDLIDGPAVLAHFKGRPPPGTVDHLEPWGGNALVDLGPGARRATLLSAAESSLVPHQADLAPDHREVDEGHRMPVLHRGDDPAGGTAHELALELDVHFGDPRPRRRSGSVGRRPG